MSLIVNPYSYSKKDQYPITIAHIKCFLTENKIKHPAFKIVDKYTKWFGIYYNDLIQLNEERCRVPVKTPGFSWSFTGYKADLTIGGVLAHETGHHIDNKLKLLKQFKKRLEEIRDDELPVTSYEPNLEELIAESFKLFILNPDLLKEGRPLRYKFITQNLQLKPIVNESWKEILRFAHLNMIKAGENWIKKGIGK